MQVINGGFARIDQVRWLEVQHGAARGPLDDLAELVSRHRQH
jgi:hypothetical protein